MWTQWEGHTVFGHLFPVLQVGPLRFWLLFLSLSEQHGNCQIQLAVTRSKSGNGSNQATCTLFNTDINSCVSILKQLLGISGINIIHFTENWTILLALSIMTFDLEFIICSGRWASSMQRLKLLFTIRLQYNFVFENIRNHRFSFALKVQFVSKHKLALALSWAEGESLNIPADLHSNTHNHNLF